MKTYLLYNLVLILGSILVLPFYLFKMIATGKYRRSLPQRLGFLPGKLLEDLSGETVVWIHTVSVGEVLSSLSLIGMIKEKHPNARILVSTVTETGNYTANSRLTGIDALIFFPLDYPWVVKRVIGTINPSLFILVETDIWPNFLRELRRSKIPSMIVNGRISPRSYRRYIWAKWFFKPVLKNVSVFSMQSHVDSERITGVGADKSLVVTTGNLKFDQEVPVISDEEKAGILTSMGLKPTCKVFVAGSTHRGEEEIVLDVFEDLRMECPDLVLILAPRNPERFMEVGNILSKRNLAWVRRTDHTTPADPEDRAVVLLDTIGELCRTYSLGCLVFVGGSFVKVGGHNLLEPAAYKKAVIFGPHMHNFLEISKELKDSGGGVQVRDKDEFILQTRKLLNDPSLLKELGEAAYGVIEKNQGATLRNMQVIDRFM